MLTGRSLQFCLLLTLFFIPVNILAQSPPAPPIIPRPVTIKMLSGTFPLSGTTSILCENATDATAARIFQLQLKKRFGISLGDGTYKPDAPDAILLQRSFSGELPQEGYQLTVSSRQIIIRANSASGIFYGLQSLLQMCPLQDETPHLIAQCEITDYPRFKWRGMHLDVARHFFSVAEVKQYIDYLAAYKFNTFHWHLTDDQGWRIAINKYPRLTETGAWRNGTLIGHYSNHPQYDTVRYGGFYSQEEIREVVAYAQQRFINIVPEIEMPGHATALLAAYPQLACSGDAFEVAKTWGVFSDVLCPTEATLSFMQDVLMEVMELFPSAYIHIGGDECPKEQWQKSPFCQKLIQQLNLKDENALQGYFTRQIDQFVTSHGRRIIGWDEILDQRLSPDAAIMSWRGVAGGLEAAANNHEVVMSPTDFCYFDYYQSRNANEPLAIGGYVPLEKVYAFEPLPAGLAADKMQYIIGGQANVWTEYIADFSKLQYMIFPRICAMSEALWSTPENRNYKDFTGRLTGYHFPLFAMAGIHFSKALLEVNMSLRPNDEGKGIIVRLSTAVPGATINYNLSSYQNEILSATNHTQFERGPVDVLINRTLQMNMQAKDAVGTLGPENIQPFEINLATGKSITLVNAPDPKYNNGGPFKLVDGIWGRLPWNGSDWLGFSGNDLDAIIDLRQVQSISKVSVGLLDDEGSWIYLPKKITVSISTDGKTFKTIGSKDLDAIRKSGRKAVFTFSKTQCTFVKIVANNLGIIPAGKPGAGNAAWLFADEIGIE